MAGHDDVQLVRAFFSGDLDNWPGMAFEMLTDDIVIHTSDGVIYVGHDGWAQWYEDAIRNHEGRSFKEHHSESVETGWVMVQGEALGTDRAGNPNRQPGYWLVHVREGRIAAVLYYRTEDEARKALAS